jgi:hypothetical protein
MDFSVIFQLRTKKFWWMDVIFYFVVSLLIATVFCYFVFLFKNNMIRKQINDQVSALHTVGTDQQKSHEADVLKYQKKINDFSGLLKDHQFASNVFAFMQAQTMPNIWFSQFTLDEKSNSVQLSGESDNMDAFSRQVAVLENNKYVKNLGSLSSSLGESARTEFNMGLVLDPTIFNYLPDISLTSTTTPSNQSVSQGPADVNSQGSGTVSSQDVTNQKLITSFHLLLKPEVVGILDETNYTVILNVPFGTDVKNLIPAVVASPGTTVSPTPLTNQDFTNPLTYKVTAADGTFQNYVVRVIVSPPPVSNSSSSNQSIFSNLTVIISVGVVIIIIVVMSLLIIRRNKK